MPDKGSAHLRDIVSLRRGATYRSSLLGGPGPVLLGLASIQRNGGFRSDSLKTYGGDSPDNLLLRPGDLYVSLKDVTQSADLLGAVARVPESVPIGRVTQDTVKLIFDREGVSKDFIYWLLRTPQYRQYCRMHANGTTNLSLSREDFLEYPVPKLTKERALLVEALGSLEDKIANNERIASTALRLAEAQFLHESTSTDWSAYSLGDVAKWFSGGTPRTSEASFWGGGIPWISAASLKSPWLRSSDRSLTSIGAENGTRLVSKGAILFVVRGMSLISEFRIGIAQRELAFGQDCKALVAHPGLDPILLFLAIKAKTREILEMVDLAGHGTGRLATDRLASLAVRLPERDLGATVAPRLNCLADISVAAVNENDTLSALRDILLPQLMSGRLRVREAERIVEDAV